MNAQNFKTFTSFQIGSNFKPNYWGKCISNVNVCCPNLKYAD